MGVCCVIFASANMARDQVRALTASDFASLASQASTVRWVVWLGANER